MMIKPEIHMIFARSTSNVIGNKGGLPDWKIEGDLPRFKELTKDAVLVMGRKTWLSLPRKLPGRYHIVISSLNSSLDDGFDRRQKENQFFGPLTLAQIASVNPNALPEKLLLRDYPEEICSSFDEARRIAHRAVVRLHLQDLGDQRPRDPNETPLRNIFIIGGENVFKAAEDVVDYVHETLVFSDKLEGDTFYDCSLLKIEGVKKRYRLELENMDTPVEAIVKIRTQPGGSDFEERTCRAVFHSWRVYRP